jgi:MFS family permease
MSASTIVAILVGMLIAFYLNYGLGWQWYAFLPMAMFGYIVTRFMTWLISEGQRVTKQFHDDMHQIAERASLGEPLD